MHYDPDVAPSASQWLDLDESERIALVEESHDANMPNLRVHAAVHATVETQIALKLPSVIDAVARLQSQGLDRHDTIHAIGSVLAGHMWELVRGDIPTGGDANAQYFAALDRLTAESWLREHE